MNYFFGQGGPGPLAGSSVGVRAIKDGAVGVRPIGRDGYGSDATLKSGLMAGKRTEGSDAAFDMKSLGKHIEALSVSPEFSHFLSSIPSLSPCCLCGSLIVPLHM